MKINLTKKEIKAIINALKYDLKKNGYSYLKDNLAFTLRIIIGEIKINKNEIKIKTK